MKLIKTYLTKNRCYKAGKTIEVKGLMLHSIGTPQPDAKTIFDSWNNKSVSVCVHAFIDGKTGIVYQTLPWKTRGWHCGGSGNDTHIGIEMCEPSSIKYRENSAIFTISNKIEAQAVAIRTYNAAVELFASLCKEFNLDPMGDGVILSHAEGHQRGIASNHADPEHLWAGLGLAYSMDTFRQAVKAEMNKTENTREGLQATSLKGMSEIDILETVAPLFVEDEKKTGVPAVVSMAQWILESGYGQTELAQKANNCFGMKTVLSNNTWDGSTWDGKSLYMKRTAEQDKNGNVYYINAGFRKYPCIEDSIADHSAYILGAKNGSKLRYAGIKEASDYKTAASIIKDGGYATDIEYVSKLCNIIERWKLVEMTGGKQTTITTEETKPYYRVRKSWLDSVSQEGAFHDLEKAKACADANPGYSVFDESGTAVYTPVAKVETFTPYRVRVKSTKLRLREDPGLDGEILGYCPVGVYTITEEVEKDGNTWGRLKSGSGWIALGYTEKV